MRTDSVSSLRSTGRTPLMMLIPVRRDRKLRPPRRKTMAVTIALTTATLPAHQAPPAILQADLETVMMKSQRKKFSKLKIHPALAVILPLMAPPPMRIAPQMTSPTQIQALKKRSRSSSLTEKLYLQSMSFWRCLTRKRLLSRGDGSG